MQVLHAKKFQYNGIDFEVEEKLERMIANVVATSKNDWAPSKEGAQSLGELKAQQSNDENDGIFCDLDDVVKCNQTKCPPIQGQ